MQLSMTMIELRKYAFITTGRKKTINFSSNFPINLKNYNLNIKIEIKFVL